MPPTESGCIPTLTHNVRSYVIPILVTLFWFISWIMTFMKLMQNKLTTGRGGGWGGGCCRVFLMFCCFYQSLVAFFGLFTELELSVIPFMIYPLMGFIAFAGNNPRWLLIYIGVNLFAYQISGAAGAQAAYITPWSVGRATEPPQAYCTNYCDSTVGCLMCGDMNGQYPELQGIIPGGWCRWGWKRTMNVLTMFGYWAFWLTTFGACSWWADGYGQDGDKTQLANAGNLAGAI